MHLAMRHESSVFIGVFVDGVWCDCMVVCRVVVDMVDGVIGVCYSNFSIWERKLECEYPEMRFIIVMEWIISLFMLCFGKTVLISWVMWFKLWTYISLAYVVYDLCMACMFFLCWLLLQGFFFFADHKE